ncbi:DMT family transporter [Nonomuraea sp. NPDC050663]|uniref:DMT family transporter n=1 Tax=Nonomuraea sp. NPDC050663 TaxID=3364370 RepID=UPI00379A557C
MRNGIVGAASAMFLVGTLAGVSGLIKDYPLYGGQAVRYLIAALIWIAVIKVMRLKFVRLTLRETLTLLALTALGLVVFNVAIIESTRAAGPALVGVVLGTVPLALALVSGKPAPRLLAGAVIVVGGATLATGLGSGNLPGLLWALVALVGEVSFSVLAIPLLPKLGAIRVSAYSTGLAVPIFFTIGLFAEGVRVPTLAEGAGYLYLGVIVTVVAFFLWYTSLPKLGPGLAGLFAGMIPVGAIVTGLALGVAVPTVPDLVGAGLVIAGIVVGLSARRSPSRSRADAAEPATLPA